MIKPTFFYGLLILFISLSDASIFPEGETFTRMTKMPWGYVTTTNVEALGSTPNKPKFESVVMKLVLYSNQSLLSEACGASAKKTLDRYLINPKPSEVSHDSYYTVSYKNVDIKGYTGQVNVFLNDATGEFFSVKKMTISPECQDDRPEDWKYLTGALGLGYQGNAIDHFTSKKTKAFAFNLEEVTKRLIFNPDTSQKTRGDVRNQLKVSNGDWHVYGSGSFAVGQKSSSQGDLALLFDVNTEKIGFPSSLYDNLIEELKTLGFPELKDSEYSKKEVEKLTFPTLTVTFGNEKLVLEPNDYLTINNDGDIVFEIEKIDIATTKYPLEDKYKKNFVVIGEKYFLQYYIQFNPSEGVISMYDSDVKVEKAQKDKKDKEERERKEKEEREKKEREEKEKKEQDEMNMLLWGGGIVLTLIIIGAVGFKIWQKKKANNIDSMDNQVRYNTLTA